MILVFDFDRKCCLIMDTPLSEIDNRLSIFLAKSFRLSGVKNFVIAVFETPNSSDNSLIVFDICAPQRIFLLKLLYHFVDFNGFKGVVL